MPFSSGSYSLAAGNPVTTNTTISSVTHNNTMSDIATALSTCVLKDGTQVITANIPMASFKFTGLGAGTAAGNSVRWEQTGPGILTTTGDVMYASSANTPARLAIGTADLPLVVNAGATAPQWGYATKTANFVYAGPASGGAAAPAFRALVIADIALFAPITNSLGADVALNNTANYFAGPSIAQGTSGTWFASGSVGLADTAGAATFDVKLWDGTTVIASGRFVSTAASTNIVCALSGYLASPAGNIRISVKDNTSTSGLIIFNGSGNSKDSTISAIRIA